MKLFVWSLWPTLLLLTAGLTRASSIVPLSLAEHVKLSDAIGHARVVSSASFKDENGLIHTRTSLFVEEALKGKFPSVVAVVHRGGQVGYEEEFCGFSPRLESGAEYVLFLQRRPDDTLGCVQGTASSIQMHRDPSGELTSTSESFLNQVRWQIQQSGAPGADVTDQVGQSSGKSQTALTGMLGNLGSRFVQPDRGEPIPYLIDAAALPSGITLEQATNAVKQALDAWTAVTSLQFRLEGIQSFGQGADTITLNDQKLRIQLHDSYNRITATNTLGIGGRTALSSPLPGAGWQIGGNIAGNEFLMTGRAYVIIEATNASLQVTSTLAEVLCHEVGHALSLAHSSEIVTNNPVLTNSIMYFRAHGDGRGATLGSYDPPIIQQVYPFNTAPFYFDRMMDITTAVPQPNIPGINEVRLGYDIQTASSNLTVTLTNVSGDYGTFTLAGNLLKYAPDVFAQTPRADPAGNSSYDDLFARVSDGTNASPYFHVRILSFNADYDALTDGIPDNWMVTHFGHANPLAQDLSRSTDDCDGDGLSNIQEFRAGMNPKDVDSAQRITQFTPATLQWQALPYEIYEIQHTTNFVEWARVYAVQPTSTVGTISNLHHSAPYGAFRALKGP